MNEHSVPTQGYGNNFETGENLLAEAELDIKRVNSEYRSKHWNRVVRASQEAVEHSLKGVLKMMGVEYPKVHDVGDVFEIACKEKGIDISEEVLQEIKEISTKLAEERAPAFYIEKVYTKQEAEEAMFTSFSGLLRKPLRFVQRLLREPPIGRKGLRRSAETNRNTPYKTTIIE